MPRWKSSQAPKSLSYRRGRGCRSSGGLGRWIMIGVFALLTSLLGRQAHGASSSSSSSSSAVVYAGTSLSTAPSENYLRRFVGQCSTFCSPGVGGMDLWLSLGEECYTSGPSASYGQQQLAGGNARSDGDNYNPYAPKSIYYSAVVATGTTGWRWWLSSLYPIVVCALVTTAGLFGGFRLGARMASTPKEAWYPLL